MNRIEWDKCFLWLAASFPQWQTTIATSAAWYDEIGKLIEAAEFKKGVRLVMAKKPSPFPPGVFEIKAALVEGELPPPGEEIWEQVMTLCRRGLTKFPEDWPKQAAIAVRACGGLQQIGVTELDKLVWLRKEFLACYTQAVNTGKAESILELSPREFEKLPEGVRTLTTNLSDKFHL